jgi:hypothetical protein
MRILDVKSPIALKMPEKGATKAHACAIAWFQNLTDFPYVYRGIPLPTGLQ